MLALAQQQTVTHSINPPTFEETTITLLLTGSVNEAAWGVTGNALYMWAWSQISMMQILLIVPPMGF
jgi:hypothetical protein